MSFCRSNLARYSGLPFDLAFLTRPTKLLLSYFLNCFLTTRYAYTGFALSTSRIKHRFRSKHISALTTAFTLSAFRSEAPSCGGASNWIMKQEAILRFSCYASAIMLQLLRFSYYASAATARTLSTFPCHLLGRKSNQRNATNKTRAITVKIPKVTSPVNKPKN